MHIIVYIYIVQCRPYLCNKRKCYGVTHTNLALSVFLIQYCFCSSSVYSEEKEQLKCALPGGQQTTSITVYI